MSETEVFNELAQVVDFKEQENSELPVSLSYQCRVPVVERQPVQV